MRRRGSAPRGRPPTYRSSPGWSAGSAGCPAAVVGGRRARRAHRRDRARPGPGRRGRLEPGGRLDPRPRGVHADAVVLATPARPTGAAARPTWCRTRRWSWPRIEYASMAIITLAFRARDFPGDARLGVPGAAGRRAGRSRRRRTPSPSGTGSARPAPDEDLLVMRARSGGTARRRCSSVPTRSSSQLALDDLADAIGLSRAAGRQRTCSGGAARCRSTPSGTSTGSATSARPWRPRRPGGVRRGVRRAGHPGLHRLGRGSRRPRSSTPWPPWENEVMTEHEAPPPGEGREGPQRHHPLHDVVGLPAAGRDRRGRPGRGGRRGREAVRGARRRRTSRSAGSTTWPACARTPT